MNKILPVLVIVLFCSSSVIPMVGAINTNKPGHIDNMNDDVDAQLNQDDTCYFTIWIGTFRYDREKDGITGFAFIYIECGPDLIFPCIIDLMREIFGVIYRYKFNWIIYTPFIIIGEYCPWREVYNRNEKDTFNTCSCGNLSNISHFYGS